MSLHLKTPCVRSSPLTSRNNTQIYLKLDCVQSTGSFKIRGIGKCCQMFKEEGCTHFVSSSGGNAGIAVAYSSRVLGVPSTIVVPETTPEFIREKMRGEGAEVIVHGSVWQEANDLAVKLCEEMEGMPMYVHPFDHPYIWDGHSTIIEEIVDELDGRKPDAIITVVGGGGLLGGILLGLDKVGWSDVTVFACETTGASKLAQSLEANEIVVLKSIDTIAKTLGASRVPDSIWDLVGSHDVRPFVMSDQDAVRSIVSFSTDHQLLVEPSCGAGLTMLYKENEAIKEFLGDDKLVLAIVCGGSMINLDLIKLWEETLF